MNRRTFLKVVPAAVAAVATPRLLSGVQPGDPVPEASPAPAAAPTTGPDIGNLKPIALPAPQKDGGKTLMATIAERKTVRTISDKKLTEQELSNLLWAAFGVNREKGIRGAAGRTAASASNAQEIDVYVCLAEGVYLYDGPGHRLAPVAAGDLRAKAGRRRGNVVAPVRLVYVADIAKLTKAPFQEPGLRDAEIQKSYYNIDAGLIAQNVYLFAAAFGLAAWFHNCDKAGFAEALKLRADQRVLYGQTVGHPAT